jgi:hypothetical protein
MPPSPQRPRRRWPHWRCALSSGAPITFALSTTTATATTTAAAAALLLPLLLVHLAGSPPLLAWAQSTAAAAVNLTRGATYGLRSVPYRRSWRFEAQHVEAAQQVSANRLHNSPRGSAYRCDQGKRGPTCADRECPYSLGAPTDLDVDFLHAPWHVRHPQADNPVVAAAALAEAAAEGGASGGGGGEAVVTSRVVTYAAAGLAFSTYPVTEAESNRHVYLECGGRGTCDRVRGECRCYAGYTGEGCRRQVGTIRRRWTRRRCWCRAGAGAAGAGTGAGAAAAGTGACAGAGAGVPTAEVV